MKQCISVNELLCKIGKRLRDIRVGRGEKLTAVESSIKLHHSIISRIENGSYRCLSFDMLAKLSVYYNIDMRELLAP